MNTEVHQKEDKHQKCTKKRTIARSAPKRGQTQKCTKGTNTKVLQENKRRSALKAGQTQRCIKKNTNTNVNHAKKRTNAKVPTKYRSAPKTGQIQKCTRRRKT